MVEVFPLVFCFVVPLFVLLNAALVAFWIWMLVECLTKEPSAGNEKLIWALVIILLNWIGALLYYFVRRPQRILETGHLPSVNK